MKKIPTVFKRDWNGDRSRVLPEVNPGCEWVLNGEGTATRKLDGTCCLVRASRLYRRREIKPGEVLPPNFELVAFDDETQKRVGWVPVGDGPEDRYHREAFPPEQSQALPDGTYELLGPKVQGNPEGFFKHILVPHNAIEAFYNVPRTFDSLREWLSQHAYIEGLVFHHPDGRMAKIKLKDFGIRRVSENEALAAGSSH